MRIYHNPRCRKSRETLQIIKEMGHEPQIIEYLKEPPSADEIVGFLDKMDMKPEDLIRKGELLYRKEYKGKTMRDEEWIEAMIKNPVLIERPIVISGDRVVLGRPSERVRDIL
ncbi:MAG: arsenate reductase (glutaredoxin) [Cyclobacteriaceae bacterium]|nr:arsenate reductase (glutaredoxin) [Cyclobacteriaceae bacterium]